MSLYFQWVPHLSIFPPFISICSISFKICWEDHICGCLMHVKRSWGTDYWPEANFLNVTFGLFWVFWKKKWFVYVTFTWCVTSCHQPSAKRNLVLSFFSWAVHYMMFILFSDTSTEVTQSRRCQHFSDDDSSSFKCSNLIL